MPTAWVTLANNQIDEDSPVTEAVLAALRDNPIALAEGDDDAPRINPVILHVVDVKAQGTTGGFNASAAIFQARTLNVVLTNRIAGASVAANRITLPAGEYMIDAHAPVYSVRHLLALYNVTDAAYAIYGTAEFTSSGAAQTRSFVRGRFTIASPKVFELQHWTLTNPVDSLGIALNITGISEKYTDCLITKVA